MKKLNWYNTPCSLAHIISVKGHSIAFILRVKQWRIRGLLSSYQVTWRHIAEYLPWYLYSPNWFSCLIYYWLQMNQSMSMSGDYIWTCYQEHKDGAVKIGLTNLILIIKKTPRSESASELYRPSDRRLSAKLLPTFADSGCHEVSVTDPYGLILDFLDRSRYFSIK
jgi:hypothetical protein